MDLFYKLLFVFSVILIALLMYMRNMYAGVHNYNLYHTKAQEMIVLENQWEKIYLKRYKFIDYDRENRMLHVLEKDIHFLKNSQIKNEFGLSVYMKLVNMEILFKEKRQVLQKFEGINAQVTNSIHYLYDLQKNIKKITEKSNKEEILFNQLFFSLSQTLLDVPIDKKSVEMSLKVLSDIQDKNPLYEYFYQHYRHALNNIETINTLIMKSNALDLNKQINSFITSLREKYIFILKRQKTIALSFFFSAFFLVILLAIYYRRIQKTTKRLRAFRYAIENSDNTIVITDADRRIEYVNGTFEKNTGYSKEEVLGRNPNILKSNLVKECTYKEMNEALDRGKMWKGELVNKKKDGTLLYENVSIVPIFLDDKLVQYLAVKLDITHYVRQQKVLQQSATVYDIIDEGIVIFDARYNVVSSNPAFGRMFGYSDTSLKGKRLCIVNSLREETALYRKMMSLLSTEGRWSGKVEGLTRKGEVLPLWLKVASVKDHEDIVQNYIAVYTNLKEIIEMEDKVDYLAYHDTLTQLPNRREFERSLGEALETAKRVEAKIAVLFIDLDRFKGINDTLGHHVGDEILVILSQRIAGLLEHDEMLARIGGDEFVLILGCERKKRYVEKVAKKILDAVREPILVQNYYLHISASIGIAIYPDDGTDRYEIVKHADAAMYDAKEKGKDRYQFYTKQLSLNVEKRLQLEQELLHALKKGELSLYYQPKYLLKTKKINGAEALLRWTNPVLGEVSPYDFISIAEETGLIVEIGYYVFEEACKAYMRWREGGLDVHSISINVSSVQFHEESFMERLRSIISRTGISAKNIDIEITERFIVEDTEEDLSILQQLHALGCRISIDDFGTGYSSISYLKNLPVDTIKIDKSFIDSVPEKRHDLKVLQAIIALGKSLGYHIVAEGIETKEQEYFLKETEIDIGQGYLFAKPMPEDMFVNFCKEEQDM